MKYVFLQKKAAMIIHNIEVDMQMPPFLENEFDENVNDMNNEISEEATSTQNFRIMREFIINTFFS